MDFGFGFGTWIWDLDLGQDLGLTIFSFVDLSPASAPSPPRSPGLRSTWNFLERKQAQSYTKPDLYRHVILGHLGVEFTSGGTTIPLNLIETEQELKGSLK